MFVSAWDPARFHAWIAPLMVMLVLVAILSRPQAGPLPALSQPEAWLAFGLILSVAALLLLVAREDRRAQQLAEEARATKRLCERETSKLAMIASRTNNAVILSDAQGRIEWVNDGFRRLTGFTLEQVAGQRPGSVLHGMETDRVTAARMREAVANQKSFEAEVLNYARNGRKYWARVELQPIRDDAGNVVNFMGMVSDVTQQHEAARSLRESESRFRAAIEGSLDAFFLFRTVRDENDNAVDFEVINVNSRALDLVKFTRDELIGMRMSDLMPQELDSGFLQRCFEVVETNRPLEEEVRVERPHFTAKWLHHQVVRVGDGLAVTSRDISGRKLVDEMLRQAATTDKLTGLANRARIHELIARAIERSRRDSSARFAVLFMDFDRFKIINDSLGHDMGDALLVESARRIRAAVESSQCGEAAAARLGGDEFVVLLPELRDPDAPTRLAQELQRVLAEPFDLHGKRVHSTVSIGITTSDIGHTKAEDFLRDADTAMYHAKGAGKARHVLFDQRMHQEVLDRMQLETDLRQAVERDELRMHYQPLVALESGGLIGFEALIRWQHATRGMVSPMQFIPIAEETGLIVPIGLWVIQRVAEQLAQWQGVLAPGASFYVSANVAPRQLEEASFVADIARTIRRAGVERGRLALEITESAFMQSLRGSTSCLEELRREGIRVLMDDFGTGHSSLASLHQFPIDGLKIDRGFIKNLDGNVGYSAVVHAIVQLAHNLSVWVVAEGIETNNQVVHLQSLECDYAQGYHFGKPMPAEAATRFIELDQTQRRSA